MHYCVISEMRMAPWRRRSSALFAFVFLVVLFSTLFAGRQCNFKADQQTEASSEAEQKEALLPLLRARMLNAKTNDYSGHDPAPAMEKPRSKLIPN